MMRRVHPGTIVAIILLALALPFSASAQVAVSTNIDTTHGFVGDVFHLNIAVDHPPKYTVKFPTEIKNLGDFSVRDVQQKSTKNVSNITYALAVYDTGNYTIPPVQFTVQPPDTSQKPLQFASDSVKVAILTLVPPDANDLKDIKPLMALPRNIPWLWIILGIFVLILVGIIVWRLRKRESRETEPEMTPAERRQSAHERAYKRLRAIEKANYPGHGAMKQHFSEVSETIRAYFEDRYFIGALEMTTTEVLRELPSTQIADSTLKTIRDVLSLSDLVKFAKHEASLEEAKDVLSGAHEIVDDTKIILTSTEEKESNAIDAEQQNTLPTENKGEPR